MKRKNNKYILLIVAILIGFLFLLVALSWNGRVSLASYENHLRKIGAMNQTSTRENDDNFPGLLSGIRTGVHREVGSLGNNQYECTDDGVYFVVDGLPVVNDGNQTFCSYLFYSDHGSDTMIKLCNRPDCSHDTLECNAAFSHIIGGITYYDGYLYVTIVNPVRQELMTLYRINPDGTDRVEILNCSSINDGQYNSYYPPKFQNGVFMVSLLNIDDDTGLIQSDFFYCKLDGQYALKKASSGYCWNDGEAFLGGSLITADTADSSGSWQLYEWNPDTNEKTVLATIPNIDGPTEYISKGYWGKECGLVHYLGQVLKVNYPDGEEEVLFDTGILRGNTARFFPDCVAIHEKANETTGENGIIHIYRYDGTKVGQVEIDIPNDTDTAMIFSESRGLIYLGCNSSCLLPTHYIDKSELGTDNGEPNKLILHQIQYPDLDQALIDGIRNLETINSSFYENLY